MSEPQVARETLAGLSNTCGSPMRSASACLTGAPATGDSIVVVRRDGAYETVAPARRGEYVNETVFVTDSQGVAGARITVLPADTLDAVFLSTDGLRFKILADLAAMAPFPPFFDDLLEYLRSPDASADAIGRFLSGLTGDQSGDDKTLVAAVRGPGVPLEGVPVGTAVTEGQ
jgi:Protein phosphatase 2C